MTTRGRSFRLLIALLLVTPLAAVATGFAPPAAAAPPGDFQTSLVVGDGLDGPSGFEIAPDGRIFILERAGTIKVVKNGQLLPEPFAVLPSESTGDRGLIGIAFDPDFGVLNHHVYFYYTGHDLLNHLVRFSAAGDVGTDGPFQLFQTESPSQLLHVGGSVRFGPDGKLYFAVGDNGTPEKAQDLGSPHGKILRINKDGSVPTDNPFYGQPGRLGAIWAYGFRNPWRFQFDGATGRLYAGDVGDFTWEEINRVVRGGNYGWPVHEGVCASNCAGFIDPVHNYDHESQSAAITGGPVYRGSMFPAEYRGNLFFGDYARGFIRRAQLDAAGNVTAVSDFDTLAGAVVDLKVAADGSLYYVNYYPGALYRVTYNTTSHAPVAAASADVTKGIEPLTVHFTGSASYDPDGDPLSYLWSFGDGSTSTEPDPTKTFTEKGVYTVRLGVTAGAAQTQAQPIVVQVGLPPTLTVATPAQDQLYHAGDTITYNAFANDAAGFDLNDANIKTVVRLHHGTHYHPFAGPLTGRAGSFSVPTAGEASADTSYELQVTATDANGLSSTQVLSVRPRRSTLTFATSPPGVALTLDGVPISTPRTVEGVEGFHRDLAAPVRAVGADGTPLEFAGWSDGHNIRHTIVTPEADTTYTATYVPAGTYTATYYDNTTLSGTPTLTRQDPGIDFDWGGGPPVPSMPDNGFGVRWTKTQFFGAGRYRFTTTSDDGVRLYLDNKRVIDEWHGQSGTSHNYVADLGTGNHEIRMEYYEGGGAATAKLTWDSTVDQPEESFHAEYWNTPPGLNGPPAIPSGPPVVARDEPAVDHDWGVDPPAPGIGNNLFMTRWSRTLNLAPGVYRFTVTADDGVRLTIDGVRVIDRWVDEAPTSYTVSLPMDGGPHNIVMDYFETGGGALARLSYSQVGTLPPPPDYRGEYWNNTTWEYPPALPTRAPELVRDEPAVDFDWGDGGPSAAIGSNHFIARWTRTDVLSAGLYRFSGVADDGIRVFVDDVPVVDLWQLQHASYSVDRVLLSGPHTIRVEYFEAGSGATAQFDYRRLGDVVPADRGYTAQYYANQNLSGDPVLTREDDAVNFDWGGGAPDPGVPADHFSARWTKTVQLPAGYYAFTTTTDDGVRLYVDGQLVIDHWTLQGPTTHTATRALTEGPHTVVMEYFDNAGGATARLGFVQTTDPPPPPPPANPFAAEYFANPTLSGPPALTRTDDGVDFDWGFTGSPGAAVPADGFSARWTQTREFEAGTYRLTATGDDGIRVLVDGVPAVDGWSDHAPTTFTADVPLTAGQHTVVVEYYERTGGALTRFSILRL